MLNIFSSGSTVSTGAGSQINNHFIMYAQKTWQGRESSIYMQMMIHNLRIGKRYAC